MKKIFLTLLSVYFLSFNSFAETKIAEISKIKNFVQIKRNDKLEKGDLLSSNGNELDIR